MMCRNPYMPASGSHVAYPCGQCNPCRFNRRRLWTSRILLESLSHERSCFVTLTYSQDFLPPGKTLVPADTQKWIKRLRFALSPRKIRYYLVGEYGDESERPHYHAILFGVGLEDEALIRETWSIDGVPIGHVHVGDVTAHSAQYCAGYTVKKMTKHDDSRLDGRYPEFARMSNRPGVGAHALQKIADVIATPLGRSVLRSSGDVPATFKFEGRDLPLGRYLRMKLRKELDFYRVDPLTGEVKYGASERTIAEASEEMSSLFETWFADTSLQAVSFKKFLTGLDDDAVLNKELRFKHEKRRSL